MDAADARVERALFGRERETPEQRQREQLREAMRDYTRAWAAAERMEGQGHSILPHRKVFLQQARASVDSLSKEAEVAQREQF